MRQRAAVLTLLAAAVACSKPDTPTENRPEFATGGGTCTAAPTLTPPAAITVAPHSSGTSRFWLLKNNCGGSPSGPWDFTASRTGAVATVGNPSPLYVTSIPGGGTAKISVPFTAGSAGSGTVVFSATNDGLGPLTITRTQNVTVTTSGPLGVPFGPADLFASPSVLRATSPFNLTLDFTDSSGIIAQINTARAAKVRFVPPMTGGGHGRYLTDPTRPTFACPNNGAPGCRFDFAKWKKVQNSFNTPAIKSAIAAAVSDGTIPFSNLMDEPNHSSWGNVMTHALLDSMSAVSKGIFPTLKTGVAVTWTWQKTSRYQNVDVMITQYSFNADTIVQRYRDSAVTSAKRQNVGLMFSLNLPDGGGRTFGTAEMSAAQVQNFGKVLVSEPFACGLLMYTWDDTYMAAKKTAFDTVAAYAAKRPAKICGK